MVEIKLVMDQNSTIKHILYCEILKPVTCAYHGGALGHSIEHCMTPKHKV